MPLLVATDWRLVVRSGFHRRMQPGGGGHHDEWETTESGLVVPTAVSASRDVRRSTTERRVAWAAIAVSVVTAIVSCVGLFLQVDVNRRQAVAIEDQVNANNLERDKERTKYALRIGFYADPDQPQLLIVQNRSVAPINDVIIGAWLYSADKSPIDKVFYRVTTIPPCTLRYVVFNAGPSVAANYVYYDTLDFRDPNDLWHIKRSTESSQPSDRAVPGRSDRRELEPPSFSSSESPPLPVNLTARPPGPTERSERAEDCGVG